MSPEHARLLQRLDRRQRGVALIEALVALVIMAFGMIALVGLQGNMRRSADLAKQRGEAIRLAQQEMERLRDFSVLALPADPAEGTRAYDDITTPDQQLNDVGDANSNATFGMVREVTDWAEPPQKAIRVQVNWKDRTGADQFVSIDSFVSRVDPGLSGSLGVAPASTPTRRPGERDSAIPVNAKDLGDKTSVFKPLDNGTVAWVFNNLNGVITGKCMVPLGTPTSALTVADVESCKNNTIGYLLSGFVRFSPDTPPNSDRPSGTALPLDMAIDITGTGYPVWPAYECYDDAPATAVNTMTYVSYYCVVYPNNATPRKWSGKLSVTGINLSGESAAKICRYSADYDKNGVISNAEHPMNYSNVTGSLTRQNFLVISATQSCPAGHAADAPAGFFSNTATVLHQPDGI